MATKYFENFPIVEYDGQKIRDITRRNTFIKNVTTNPFAFQPYTVHEGERPEDIAQFYYGSTDYTWLVYLSNNIVDPYHEWPKATEDFNNYLIDKYKDTSGKTGNDVLDWTREEGDENIVYYYREIDPVFAENVVQIDDSENQDVTVDLSREETDTAEPDVDPDTGGGIIY